MAEGKFDSHFKNRLTDEFAKNPESGFLTSSREEGKVMVVGNGSFIANYYDSMPGKTGKMMYRPISFNNLRYDEVMAQMRMQPLIYGNQEFFQNMVDYINQYLAPLFEKTISTSPGLTMPASPCAASAA